MPFGATHDLTSPQADGLDGRHARYAGTLDCVRQMFAREGLTSFYRGYRVNVLRALPGAAVQFYSYETLQRLLGI